MSDVNNGDVMPDMEKLDLNDLNCPSTCDDTKILTSCMAPTNIELNRSADIPLLTFLDCIDCASESINNEDKDEDAARKMLEEAKKVLEDIRKDRATSSISRALEYLYQTTVMDIFHENDHTDELQNLQENLVVLSDLNEKERAVVAGYNCFVLSRCSLHSINEAIDLAAEAVKGNEENALWHLLLGHCIRMKRRAVMGHTSAPSELETSSFRTAAKYSPHALYKIFNIQAIHEANFTLPFNQRDAFSRKQLAMYEDVLRTCGDAPTILLRVVLGMLRCHRVCDFRTVHSTLDRVEQLLNGNCASSLHYRGRAYKLQGNYEKAFEYLGNAKDLLVFPIDCEYASCMVLAKKRPEEIIDFLLKIQSKYKDSIAETQQHIRLDLGIMYYTLGDYKNSSQYFLEAIEIQPTSAKLKEFHQFSFVKMPNTYYFISKELLPKCNPRNTVDFGIDQKFKETIVKLHRHLVSH